MKLLWIAGGAAALVLLAGCAWVTAQQNVAEPSYTSLKAEEPFELRQYPTLYFAEVTRSGARGEAASSAFRPLANYIFANERDGEKIAMTAPVTQKREKIAMTAPVTQAPTEDGDWTVRFIMPEGYTLENLPKPVNSEVRLVEEAPRKVAVIRFSGRWRDESMTEQEDRLRGWIAEQGLEPVGAPTYAFYNDPFTPGFLRRNEVMIEVAG